MIKLEGVSKSYGSIKVLENLNFKAEVGKSTCIVGRSGCGKSTLLKVIALIIKPNQGRVIINGIDVYEMKEAERDQFSNENITYSFQAPLLIPYLSVLENVTEIIDVNKGKAVQVLSQLGLSDRLNYKPSKLSGGEKKRLDVARAFLKNGSILVVDEPSSSLDPLTCLNVMGLLKTFAKNGGTVVYSSVEPSDASFADTVVTM